MRNPSRREFVKAGVGLCAWGVAGPGEAAESADKNGSLRLWYRKPAADWNQALPLGNGRLGAMVFGGITREQLQLNEETVWTGAPKPPPRYETKGPANLPRIRKLVFQDKWSEAQELFGQSMRTGQWFAKYQPMGSLWLEFPGHEQASGYQRELDLGRALSRVRYRLGETTYTRETFISAADQVMVVRLTADGPGRISAKLSLEGERDDKGKIPGKPETRILADTLVLRGRSAPWDPSMGRIEYECRAKVISEGGSLSAEKAGLLIQDANSVTVLLAAATNFKSCQALGGDPKTIVAGRLEAAAQKTYLRLVRDHLINHQGLFNRVALDLPTCESSASPTDERLRKVATGSIDPALEALFFQLGRYLMISSSRPGTQPGNLQGIWNKDYQPAWDGKYTSNINLEMNYWPTHTANLSECIEPLLRMVEELSVSGRLTARDGYGARGWAFGFNTDLWRTTGPMGGKLSFWSTWQTGGAWLCAQLYDAYRFTGARDLLRRIYPLMKGAAEFFLDTLQEHPESGFLVTCPSSSPENRHHKIDGKEWAYQPSICAGPTMDSQILRDLFGACVEAATELGVDEDFRQSLDSTARRLPPTMIGRHGQIQEWLDDWDDPKDTHRHLSHLYGIYPGSEITPERTPALIKAARTTIRQRGLLSTGWSMAWKVALFARMGDGEMSHRGIRYMLNFRESGNDKQRGFKGGVTNNLFCSHPPFQIDGNFGTCAGIAEMLLQSHDGTLHLLPALPKAWKDGRVTGLCARGGFEVDIEWAGHRLQRAVVRSRLGKPCHLRHQESTKKFPTETGASYTINGALELE